MNEESRIPSHWQWVPLIEISDVIPGNSPPSKTYNEHGEGLPFYQGKTEFGEIYPKPTKWCTSPKKVAQEGDVLLSVRAPVGPTNLCPEKSCIGRGLTAIRPKAGIEARYVLWAIRAHENSLARKGTGTTFDSISSDDVRNFEIPLAPSPEQKCIVARIEELFSNLDAGVGELETAGRQLDRYRLSVLQAAVEGRLTADWRRTHDPEPADRLLDRILEERRAQWEKDYRAKYEAKGKEPPSGWKSRYSEAGQLDADDLPELPEGWIWTDVKNACIVYGGVTKNARKGGDLVEMPYLRVANVYANELRLDDVKKIKVKRSRVYRYFLEKGDLLVVEGNGSKSQIGRVARGMEALSHASIRTT